MRLLCRADARRIPLGDSSVHCCVCSPPYWGLRDYGTPGQLGLERTPEEYVANMVAVFREVRRCLRDDGTLWLNLGDSYVGSANAGGEESRTCNSKPNAVDRNLPTKKGANLKPKDLVGIPWRVAFALQADGWYLRSDIIWSKPNPMPESVRDRPTKAHEYLFLLSKSATYFYDAQAIAEPATFPDGPNAPDKIKSPYGQGFTRTAKSGNAKRRFTQNIDGEAGIGHSIPWEGSTRNRRTVWTVATQPYSGAHFATFPEKLIEPCILAGTSAKGCCPLCGAPWERVVEKTDEPAKGSTFDKGKTGARDGGDRTQKGQRFTNATTGWTPTCAHGKEPVPCRVLDPFAGTATTVRVANRLGRKGIGLDISAAYLTEQAKKRTSNVQMDLA